MFVDGVGEPVGLVHGGHGCDGQAVLGHAAGIGNHHGEQRGHGNGHHLHVPQCGLGQRWRGDYGHLTGDFGQQSCRTLQRVLETHRSGQEAVDAAALRLAERHHGSKSVHKVSIALFGGHATGRSVRLNQIAFVLQSGHVVTDGGRTDAEIMVARQRSGAHGLLRTDVILHHGAQHQHAS